MIIYLDIVFIKELFINFIIIFCTKTALSRKVKISKCIIGSILLSLYTVISFFCTPISNMIGRIFCALGITYYLFRDKSIIEIIKSCIVFYIVTFLIAGVYLYTYSNELKNVFYIISIVLIIGILINDYKKKYKISNYMTDIELNILNEKMNLRALIDTGNSLKSSEKEDVIVLSRTSINKLKNDKIKNLLMKNYNDEINIPQKLIRVINFKTIDNKNSVKYGLKIKNIKCFNNSINENKTGVVICAEGDFDGYDAIISPDFISIDA